MIGYGNIMSLASALWQIDLKDKYQLDSGAFIPTLSMEMKPLEGEKAIEQQQNRMKYILKILKNNGSIANI